MKCRVLLTSVGVSLLLALVACSSPQRRFSETRETAPGVSQTASVTPPSPALPVRQLSKLVSLDLAVADTQASAARIESEARTLGGYVSSSNEMRVGGQVLYQLTIRVPSERLTEAVKTIRDLAVEVFHESQQTQDVTDQLVDLDARLKTLRATETELQALLSESRSRNQDVEGIMAIYRELTQIRTEIERLEAQRQSLSNRVEFSEISVSLRPSAATRSLAVEGWNPLQTLRNSIRALLGALRFFGDAVIVVIVVILPIGAMLVLPIVWLRRVLRGSRLRRGGTNPPRP